MDALIESPYLAQSLTVFLVTIVAMISPGPDFAVIARNSLVYSRRAGIYSALGMASAVWVHVAYCLAGLGLVISQSILLYSGLKYLGAAYLIYLGIQGLRSRGSPELAPIEAGAAPRRPAADLGAWPAYRMGFLTNALNPKATLFFLALFTQVIRPDTPLAIALLYGLMASLTGAGWFTLVATCLTHRAVRERFRRLQRHADRVVGGLLVLFGLRLAFSHSRG